MDIKPDEAPVFLAYLTYLYDGLHGNESSIFFSTADKFLENRGDFDADIRLDEYKAMINAHDVDELIEHCASVILDENKTSVFCYLVDGALSDGVLVEKERNILLKIQKQFNISDELGIAIVDVFIMKNSPTSY